MGSTEEFRKTLSTGDKVKAVPADEVEKTLRRDVERARGNLDRYLARRTAHPPCEPPGSRSTP